MKELVEKIGNVDLEITYGCGLDCLHCYNTDHIIENELELDELFDIIEQITNLGFPEVHITGGEPLSHPDITTILTDCEENKLAFLLETNATHLTSELLADISNLQHLKIRASIDGPEDIHNAIRRSPTEENVYRMAVTNLVRAQDEGIPIQITTSVNNINYAHILRMVDDLYSRGLRDVRLRLSMPTNNAYNHWQILRLNREKMSVVQTQAETIKTRYDMQFNAESIFRAFPNNERKCFITPQGDVKPYPFIDVYVGNTRISPLKKILEQYARVKFPKDVERMMNAYLTELGMGEKHD
ncbi:MAG: radical SAM protein [Nanoarchaeota archaeon]